MKQITFKSVRIKNFLSVGDVPVEINFRTGLHIITGVNKDRQDRRNGVGKSTIADAIHFALFGDTLRELKKEHIVNNITKSKCEVILTFDVVEPDTGTKQYKIVRKISPTKCFLFENDDDITRDSISNTTGHIQSIINSSQDVFQNCVIMTVNNTVPFMAKKKLDKRKFIEGILNLQVFSDMLSQARSEYNEMSKEFDLECMRYEEVSKNIENLDSQLLDHVQAVKRNIETLESRKKENDRNIQRASEAKSKIATVVDVNELNDKLVSFKSKRSECNSSVLKMRENQSRYKAQLEFKQQEIDKLNSTKDMCPTCKRPHESKTTAVITESVFDLQKECDDIQKSLDGLKVSDWEAACKVLQSKIEDLSATIKAADKCNNDRSSLIQTLSQLNQWNQQIEKDIDVEDTVGESLKLKIRDTSKRLEGIQLSIRELKSNLATLEVVKYIVSEEGVKSYVVKKILQLLNNKLAYYLKKMEANCVCVFDEYFEEQIFDEKGQLCSYFNFSGAERKNIDLACLFAFMDIRRLQGDVTYNFNIYDELLDSSLDEQGIYIILNILKERVEKYNEMCYIITHRKESTLHARGDVITLQKQKGITTRVDNQ
ncbi:AAA family ATPase [bacterium]|nr:AAA family ATPase [bacterium]